MSRNDDLALTWMARYFGRRDYLPLSGEDLEALSEASTPVDFEDGDTLYRKGEASTVNTD